MRRFIFTVVALFMIAGVVAAAVILVAPQINMRLPWQNSGDDVAALPTQTPVPDAPTAPPQIEQPVITSSDGCIKIPADLLSKYGLKSGDEVAIIETDSGLFIGNREQIAEQLLDRMGQQVRDMHPGLTDDELLDLLMQRGRDDVRPALLKLMEL